MKRFLAVAALAAAVPALAQDVQQQGKTIAFPTFTTDQNWARATTLMNSSSVGGFTYAKAHGATAEEYGHFLGKTYAPGWGDANTGSAIRYARSIQNNWRAFSGGISEVLSANDTLITARYSRTPYTTYFGPTKEVLGVTLDEYETINRIFQEDIGRHLGLRFTSRVDGDWVVMTISGQGSAAVMDFPRTAYRVELTAQVPGINPDLVGASEVSFAPGGKYTITHGGKPYLTADYDLSLDEIVLRNAPGADCAKPGRYRWTVNPANGNLTLGRLTDDCAARLAFFTGHPFIKK
jgi:hypothetical protein